MPFFNNASNFTISGAVMNDVAGNSEVTNTTTNTTSTNSGNTNTRTITDSYNNNSRRIVNSGNFFNGHAGQDSPADGTFGQGVLPRIQQVSGGTVQNAVDGKATLQIEEVTTSATASSILGEPSSERSGTYNEAQPHV